MDTVTHAMYSTAMHLAFIHVCMHAYIHQQRVKRIEYSWHAGHLADSSSCAVAYTLPHSGEHKHDCVSLAVGEAKRVLLTAVSRQLS